MYAGVKVNNLDEETREKILTFFDTDAYSVIKAMLTLNTKDFFTNFYAHEHAASVLSDALIFAFAQGLFVHADQIEHRLLAMIESHVKDADRRNYFYNFHIIMTYTKILKRAISRGDLEACTLLLTKLGSNSEYLEKHSSLATKLGHHKIADLLPQPAHLPAKSSQPSRIIYKPGVLESRNKRRLTLQEDEGFVSDEEFESYAIMYNRFVEHILNNPPRESYLSLLCGDIRRHILSPMSRKELSQFSYLSLLCGDIQWHILSPMSKKELSQLRYQNVMRNILEVPPHESYLSTLCCDTRLNTLLPMVITYPR